MKVRTTAAPPWVALPKLVKSVLLGVVSPSVILAPLPRTVISGGVVAGLPSR